MVSKYRGGPLHLIFSFKRLSLERNFTRLDANNRGPTYVQTWDDVPGQKRETKTKRWHALSRAKFLVVSNLANRDKGESHPIFGPLLD